MFEEEKALKQLKKDYPDLQINPSGSTAKLKIAEHTELIIDPGKHPQKWLVLDLKKGVVKESKESDITRDEKLQILTIADDVARVCSEVAA
jgi:hypothetical protein